MDLDSLQQNASTSRDNAAGAAAHKGSTTTTLGDMSEEDLVTAKDAMEVTRKALEEEWRTVQKVRDGAAPPVAARISRFAGGWHRGDFSVAGARRSGGAES